MKKVFIVVFFVILGINFLGFAGEKKEIKDVEFKKLVESCEKLKGSQKYGAYYSEAFLYSCLNDDHEKDVLYLIGDSLFQMGAYYRAENIYRKILDTYPNDEMAKKALVDLTTRLKKIEFAIDEKTRLAEKGEKVAENYASLTGIYIGLNEYSKAHRNLDKANQADKNHFLVTLMKGAIQDRMIKPATEAIKISSEARDLVVDGKINNGLQLYSQALSLSIGSPLVYLNMADSLLKVDNYKGAAISLEEAYLINSELSNAFEIGNIYLFLKNYDKALKFYNYALNTNSELPKVLLNVSKCYAKKGLQKESNEALERATRLNPSLKKNSNDKTIVRGVVLK